MKKIILLSLFVMAAFVCRAQGGSMNYSIEFKPPGTYVDTYFYPKAPNIEVAEMSVNATKLPVGQRIVIEYNFSSGNSSSKTGTITLTGQQPHAWLTYHPGQEYCYIVYRVIENRANAGFYVNIVRSYRPGI